MVALGLILALLVLLPSDERHRIRGPFTALLVFSLMVAADIWLPGRFPGRDFARLVALFLLLASMGRSGFLLFVYGIWVRRWARPLPKILRDVVQALVYFGAGLLVLRAAGMEPGSLLATSAFLTAVIGLSLQDTLGNLFAGLAIQAQRPFEVGDWIRFGEVGDVGRVVEINWRATRLQTLAQIEITVPNGAAAKSHVVNFSKPTHVVRQQVRVAAPFEVSPDRVRQFLLQAVRHTPDVLGEPEPVVVCRDFDERGVVYEMRYFIDRFDRHELVESEVRERLWYALNREGHGIPVPGRRMEVIRGERRNDTLTATSASADFRFQLLSRLDLFRGLEREELEALAAHCRHEAYAPEELIVHQGEAGSEMYVVERGRVRIEAQLHGGRRKVIGVLERGEFFGEMSLLTGEPRAADVVAELETEVIALARDDLAPIIERNPQVAERLSRVLTERRQRLEEAYGTSLDRETNPAAEEDELLRRIRRFFGLK